MRLRYGPAYKWLGRLARRLLPGNARLAVRALVLLPPRVARFYVRADAYARTHGDAFALTRPARPEDLAALLGVAKGRRHVVELGTGVGWTAIALALADHSRRVLSYDPVWHPHRVAYLRIAGEGARERVELRLKPGEDGPADGDQAVDLLFIDIGGHSRADTIAGFLAWRAALAPGAAVAFHDYGPAFPGVAEALGALGLTGSVLGESLFVWIAPAELIG